MLLICLNVDYRVLFTPLDEDVLRDAFEFYTTFYKSPPAIKVCTRARVFLPKPRPFVLRSPSFAPSALRTQPWPGPGPPILPNCLAPISLFPVLPSRYSRDCYPTFTTATATFCPLMNARIADSHCLLARP